MLLRALDSLSQKISATTQNRQNAKNLFENYMYFLIFGSDFEFFAKSGTMTPYG